MKNSTGKRPEQEKNPFRRQEALRSAAGNGPNHDQEKVSRGWQAGDERAAFRGLTRYPGRGRGVEDLDEVAARRDIEDELIRERLSRARPRFTPQPELIKSRQESEPSDPEGKASDSANRSALQRSGVERRRSIGLLQRRSDKRPHLGGRDPLDRPGAFRVGRHRRKAPRPDFMSSAMSGRPASST